MKVIIQPLALETIHEISELIDGINTPGAGDRWADRILDFILDYARPNTKYALCRNKELAEQLLSCIAFNNWIVVFNIDSDKFIVQQVVHGTLLK